MKLCIISDLHCKYQLDTSESSETIFFSNMPRIPVSQHPVASMLKTIENNSEILSDVLLCLGDLGHKADEQGIISAWSSIEEIHLKLGSKFKIGIPGNHDINSRKKNGKDAFTFIQSFHEGFPSQELSLNNKFWAQGYCFHTHDNCLFLLVNTVHNHGDEEKSNFASLKEGTIESITEDLSTTFNTEFKYKICIMHHHPIKHSNIKNYKDSDSLDNGDDLISVLNRYNFNIVIHGHKHQPRICEINGLPIFATGSFSCFTNLQGTQINTMFHVINLMENKNGTIISYEYNVKDGWGKQLNKYFPPKIGFGGNLDLNETAKHINDLIIDNGNRPIPYSDILLNIPLIEFLIPDNLIKLGDILRSKYNLMASPEYPLEPSLITPLN